MPEAKPLVPLLAALRDAVIGGVAASFLGRPRVTRDIDALISLDEKRWKVFLSAGAQFGFIPRRRDTLRLAREMRVLMVHHEPSGIDTDIVLGSLPFEQETVARAVPVTVGDVSIPLPTAEDLIIMKAVAHRPRDLADIESIIDTQPGLDLRRVRRWVRNFSSALEMPEILRDLETILAHQRKRKR